MVECYFSSLLFFSPVCIVHMLPVLRDGVSKQHGIALSAMAKRHTKSWECMEHSHTQSTLCIPTPSVMLFEHSDSFFMEVQNVILDASVSGLYLLAVRFISIVTPFAKGRSNQWCITNIRQRTSWFIIENAEAIKWIACFNLFCWLGWQLQVVFSASAAQQLAYVLPSQLFRNFPIDRKCRLY